ncbi:hypothetical protein [Parvimonas sp. G1604]|uniref:hypothetical protein n=1 Tax=Parvimonas sp. G1604 TaxID=3388845 RepID=UPI00397F58FB
MKDIYYYGMIAFLTAVNIYYGVIFYRLKNKDYVSNVYDILLNNSKIKNPEKILKIYGLVHIIIAVFSLIFFFIKNVELVLLLPFGLMILDNLFLLIISKKQEKFKYIISIIFIIVIQISYFKLTLNGEPARDLYNVSYIIVYENGLSDFKELPENSYLEKIPNENIKNISKIEDNKIEFYDQKGKLLIESELYEAEVKNIETNEFEKSENIIKYKGTYYKIYEPKEY